MTFPLFLYQFIHKYHTAFSVFVFAPSTPFRQSIKTSACRNPSGKLLTYQKYWQLHVQYWIPVGVQTKFHWLHFIRNYVISSCLQSSSNYSIYLDFKNLQIFPCYPNYKIDLFKFSPNPLTFPIIVPFESLFSIFLCTIPWSFSNLQKYDVHLRNFHL